MKKLGFTLSEVIIALGIIGVIAAITAPLLGSIIPDKNKVAVLKVYKTLTEINQEILNDPALYRQAVCAHPFSGVPVSCAGLGFVTQPLIAPYNEDERYSGVTKYPFILASKLQIQDEIEADDTPVEFQTIDNVSWTVQDVAGGVFPDPITGALLFGLGYEITIDINGSEQEPNCSECKNADIFTFSVDNNGKVSGGDSLCRAYIANPNKLNDKRADYAAAGIN